MTKEDKLRELVLAYKLEPPEYWNVCALQRAIMVAKSSPTMTLSDFAVTLGFSRPGGYGIMDGWDVSAGARPHCTSARQVNPDDYDNGYQLGVELYKAAIK